MRISPISYDTTLTMPEGGYQHITHDQKNFGIYISEKDNLKLFLLTDIDLIMDGSVKTVYLFNENDNYGVRFIDKDLDLNSTLLNYNLQDLSSILEEKPVVKQIYDFIIEEGYYRTLESLIIEGSIVEVYFYKVSDLQKLQNSFDKNMHSLLEDAEYSADVDPQIIFQLTDINYFDIFPLFENIEKNNFDIIPGCELIKFDLFLNKNH